MPRNLAQAPCLESNQFVELRVPVLGFLLSMLKVVLVSDVALQMQSSLFEVLPSYFASKRTYADGMSCNLFCSLVLPSTKSRSPVGTCVTSKHLQREKPKTERPQACRNESNRHNARINASVATLSSAVAPAKNQEKATDPHVIGHSKPHQQLLFWHGSHRVCVCVRQLSTPATCKCCSKSC